MKLGFIGCGNMASAIISGIVENRVADVKDIFAFDINSSMCSRIREKYSINTAESENDIVKNCDAVILAVKPNAIGSVLDKINITLSESDTLIISIAAGKDLNYLRSFLSHDNRIIRVMPNINATVGSAMSAFTANDICSDEDKQFCKTIFDGVGKTMELDENYFPLFGVLAGCAPAFCYLFADALATAGVQNGIKKDISLEIAAQVMLGSAEMLLKSGKHPGELIDMVCSPGGTTIEGITSLKADGIESAIYNAVNKAVEKDIKL